MLTKFWSKFRWISRLKGSFLCIDIKTLFSKSSYICRIHRSYHWQRYSWIIFMNCSFGLTAWINIIYIIKLNFLCDILSRFIINIIHEAIVKLIFRIIKIEFRILIDILIKTIILIFIWFYWNLLSSSLKLICII